MVGFDDRGFVIESMEPLDAHTVRWVLEAHVVRWVAEADVLVGANGVQN